MFHTAASASLGCHNRAGGQRRLRTGIGTTGTITVAATALVLGAISIASAVAAPVACATAHPCPAGQFCAASGRCVSAVVRVVAGAGHSCALHRDGGVSCWGFADAVKGTTGAVSAPVAIAGLDHVVALSAGHHETCAVVQGGQGGQGGHVRCFGLDDFTLRRDDGPALAGVRAVALGAGFGCALAPPGTFCWGRNESGQLGRPLATTGSPNALLSLPGAGGRFVGAGLAAITVRADASKAGGQICGWGNNATHVVTAAATGVVAQPICASRDDVLELAVGAAHACVRHARGTFSCWGERYYGQLGTGGGKDKADVPPPGQAVTLPAPALQIAVGAGHTCVLVAGGRIYCFGLNSAGQIGPGPDQILAPRAVTGLHGRAISIGSGSAARHTCAVLADGRVDCWGNDDAGQLGDGPKTLLEGRFSRDPVAVAF